MADWTDFITCPKCGEVDAETSEYPRGLQHDGDTAEWDCTYCGAKARVTPCVSYSYQTAPPGAPDARS